MEKMLKLIEKTGLSKSKTTVLTNQFKDFFEQAGKFEKKALKIVVTDESETEKMSEARELRLAIRKIRIDTESTRKELKEQSLAEGKAIDGMSNEIKGVIEPIEKHLLKQEKFAEIREEERKQKQNAERISKLSKYVEDVTAYNLKDMDQDTFDQFLENSKLAHEAVQEAEKKAERDRIDKEKKDKKEREALELENENLRKENKKKELARQKEADKKREAENKLREKQDADRKIERDKKAADRKAAMAPDREKLLAFSASIKDIVPPSGLSKEAKSIGDKAEEKLFEVSQWIENQVLSL